MLAELFFANALYLAIPSNFTAQQEQMAVAAVAAVKNAQVTAVEVKEGKGPRMVIISEATEQQRCCPPPAPRHFSSYEEAPEDRPVAMTYSMAGSSGPNFFTSGFGVKLGRGTVILLGEGGLGQPEGIFDGDRDDDDIYFGLGGTGKVDPLAFTKFPVRPTMGYRYFRLFLDDADIFDDDFDDIVDRKFYTQGWILGINATVYRGDRDTFELYVDAGESKLVHKTDNITRSRKKTIWTFGFAYTF